MTTSESSNPQDDWRILREALEHVHYYVGDGYTPSRVQTALRRLEEQYELRGEQLASADEVEQSLRREIARLKEQVQTLRRERDEAIEDALRLGAFSGKDEAVAEVERLKEQLQAARAAHDNMLSKHMELEEQLEALQESYRALHRQWNDGQEALEWIADWPHVKLYGGHETAYMPLIVHERAKAAAQLRGVSSPR
jgi:DNA repair exonuclease SbcCD ATPase subunit